MNTQEGAREILAHLQALYVPKHEYVSVRDTDFPHLDLRFYQRARTELEAAGFLHLEDCEDRTLATVPGNVLLPVLIRVMVSADGAFTAGIYHARIKPLWLRALLFVLRKLPGRTVDLETEFADGSFVCTSNALGASAIKLPPLVRCEYLPRQTPLPRLLARHRERVAARQAEAGVPPRRLTSIADVRASQNRMNALKAAYRGEIGGITQEELEQLAVGGRAQAAEVFTAIQQLQARDVGAAPVSPATGAPLAVGAEQPSEPLEPARTADDRLLEEIRARGERAPGAGNSSPMLLLTAVLFIGLGGFSWGWRSVLYIAVAIGLHELGHVIAMRLFGYKNVRMLFLPFFGGLATGEPHELDATKNALVALAGPAFGVATAALAGMLALLLGAPLWLVQFAWVSLFLNAFNLLPLVPLDGGQFANDALFSRFPVLELVFRLLAIAGLGWLAWSSQAWLLGLLAVFMLITTQTAFRRACLIRDARRDPVWQTRPLDRDAVAALRGIVTRIFRGVSPEKLEPKLPEHVHGVWLEIRKRFPGPGRTVALLGAYFALCFVAVPVIGILLATFLPRPTL